MSDPYEEILGEIRGRIDVVDEKILRLLAERWGLVKEIHDLKKRHGLPIRQTGRYQAMVARLSERAKELGADQRLVHAVWEVIHDQSIRQQEELDADKS